MNKIDKYTKRLIMVVFLLLLFGVVMVFSTSWPYSYRIKGNEIDITRKHVIFVAISILSMLLFSHINILKFRKQSPKNFLLLYFLWDF